eukprot:893234_1
MAQHGKEHYTKLTHIFQRVLSNLDDQKYRNLNANKIDELFAKCKVCIGILHSAGFESNNKRLILDVTKMNDLITTHENVKALISSDVVVSAPKPLRIEKEAIYTYEVLSGSTKDEAYRYLESRTVTEQFYYVIVETPDGNFGKDINGDIFKEPAKNPKTNIIKVTELTYLNSHISDEHNVEQYRNLKKESVAIPIHTPSVALLPAFNTRMSRNSGQRCDLTDCEHLGRLCLILQLYHTFIQQQQDDTSIDMHDICNDEYNTGTASILDDFHHLLHNHDHEFEYIHNQLVNELQPCALDKCTCTIAIKHYSTQLVPSSADIQETVQQQILNKIHCYYLHSFDIGYRLRRRDKQKLLDTEQKHEAKVEDEGEYDHISTARALSFISTNNAYTKLTKTRNNHKFKSDLPELVHVYDHGIRYFYWPYYEDKVEMNDVALRRGDGGFIDKGFREANKGCSVKEWYIDKKYPNLKVELLQNTICRLSEPKQYELLREQANKHRQTLVVKAMVSRGRDVYNIEDGMPITVEHLIAMMAYCNKDALQAQFSETFRRRENENNCSMIQRHKNYANFGRLLREFVECFGQNGIGNRTVGEQQLFHGISSETQFGSVMTRLKGPVSATSDFCIALRFAGQKGLILQFSLSIRWIIPTKEDEYGTMFYKPVDNRCAFLDCHWLSDYPEEQERFFIGGYGYFYFENIYNIHAAHSGTDQSYILYIPAIRLLSETLQCSTKYFGRSIHGSANTKAITQMVFRLLSHELHKHYPDNKDYHVVEGIPPYIDQLFHNYCT